MRSAALILGILIHTFAANLAAVTPYTFKPVQVYGGGYVDGIVFHPGQANLVYARTDMGGVYRYNTAASSWIPLTDFLNRDQADYMGNLALAVDPSDVNKVYVMCGKYTQSWAGNGALLASADQGATWTINALPFKVGGNEDGRSAGERLAVDPNLGSILFGGSNNSALYKSTNSGVNWATVPSFTAPNITWVLFDKASGSSGVATPNIYVGVNATTNNVYRSTDGGANWALLAGQPTGNIPMRARLSGTRLYVTYANALGPNGVTAGAIYRVDTGTLAWTAVTPPAGQGGWCGIGVFPGAVNDQLAAATMDRWWPADEIYTSANNGGAWTAKLSTGVVSTSEAPWTSSSTPHWISDIEIDPFNADHAFWVTGYGVYNTSNLTAATPLWRFNSKGIEQTVPLQLVSPPSGAPLLTAMGDVDGFRHDNLDAPPLNRHLPLMGTTLAIAFAEAVPSKLVKAYNAGAPNNYGAYSTDGGSNWTAFAAFPAGATGGGTRSIAISPDGNNIVWCPPGAACSRSVNNGGAWTAVTGGLPAGLEPVADRVNSNKFYAADWNTGQCWVSTNGGASFAVGATGLGTLPSYQAGDMSLKAALGLEGELWLTTGAGGLWHSANSGATFAKLGTLTNAYEIATGKSQAAGYPALYVYGTSGGVRGFYRSDDTGATWTRINDNSHQYGWSHDFSGDPRVYGRLYMCFEGRGALYGDIPAAGTPTSSPTRTPTATSSATPTATRSATPTATQSPLAASSTPSPSSSPTRTATASATRSATPSVTTSATPSGTPSASPSATRSATASPTPSGTRSATASATPSASPSATRSSTATRTPSATRTASPTATETPSISPTFTDVPAGSSPTDTPTISPTFSLTATDTASPSGTPTETPVDSETSTPTPSPVDSDTPTPMNTATVTPSNTATLTPADSATPTPLNTASATPANTATLTPANTFTSTPVSTGTLTPVDSATSTPANTATSSPASTGTPTPAATATLSPVNTQSATPVSTFTATPSGTPGPVGTATASPWPVPGGGTLSILELAAVPNPGPHEIRVRLDGACDSLRLRIYSPALVRVLEGETGPLQLGWNTVVLPPAWTALPAGLYFARVTAQRGSQQSLPSAPLRLVQLR